MAVYTKASDQEIASLVAGYGIGDFVEARPIAEGVENSNFLLSTARSRFILTIYEKRVSRDDLPYFLELMEFMSGSGIPCPLPVHDKSGAVLQTLCGKPASIVTFLEGKPISSPSAAHMESLGDTLGRFHLAGMRFGMKRRNDLSISGWKTLAEKISPGADSIEACLSETIKSELYFLAANWPAFLPSGTIHADLFPDNVFFDGTRVSGIIDFYFACTDLLAYELAICINAWCFNGGKLDSEKLRAFLSAYDKIRPVTAEEKAAMPVLLRGAALRFLLTRAHDLLNHNEEALVTPKNPEEYLSKLRYHQLGENPCSM